jgi:hypothetical protein
MLSKIKNFVKNREQWSWTQWKIKTKTFIGERQADIILVIGVILISLFSFAMGYLVAKNQDKEPLKLEMPHSQLPNLNATVIDNRKFL